MLPEDEERLEKYVQTLSKTALVIETVVKNKQWVLKGKNSQVSITRIFYDQSLPFDERFIFQPVKELDYLASK